MADELQVKITAQIDDLISNLQKGSDALTQSFTKIEESVNGVSEAMNGKLNTSLQTTSESMSKFSEAGGGVGAALETITSKINSLAAFTGVGLLVEGLKKLNDQVIQAGENAQQMLNLSAAFGITTTQLQGLQVIADRAGVPFETLRLALTRMQNMMTLAAEGNDTMRQKLNDLGISLQDMVDPTFSALDALVKLGQSGDNAREILALFGRNAQQIVTVAQALAGGLKSVDKAADDVGAQSKAQLTTLAAYATAVNELDTKWKNLKATWGEPLIAVMTAVVDKLGEMTRAAQNLHPFDALAEAWEHLKQEFTAFSTPGPAGAFAMGQALNPGAASGSFTPPPAAPPPVKPYPAINPDAANIGKVQQARLDAVHEEATQENQIHQQMLQEQLSMGETSVGEFVQQEHELIAQKLAIDLAYLTQKRALDLKAAQDSIKSQTDQLAAQQAVEIKAANGNAAQIAAINARYAAQRKALEASVMADVIKDDAEISKAKAEAAAKNMQIERQVAEQSKKLAMETATAERDATLQGLDFQEQQLRNELRDKQINASQFLTQDLALIEKERQAWIEYYKFKESLDKKDAAALLADQTALANKLNELLKKQQQAHQLATESIMQRWKQVASTIQSGMTTALTGLIEGTMNVKQAFSTMVDSIIRALVQMLAQWIVTTTMQKVLGVETASTGIASAAALAGAQGVASFAGAPWPIDIGAPVFGAAMFSDALAYQSGLSVAEQGFDIPAGVNPLTQLHEQEMVLPANLANAVRQMAASNTSGRASGRGDPEVGSQSGRRGGGIPNYSVHLHASGLDGRSIQSLYRNHAGKLARALQDHMRRRI